MKKTPKRSASLAPDERQRLIKAFRAACDAERRWGNRDDLKAELERFWGEVVDLLHV